MYQSIFQRTYKTGLLAGALLLLTLSDAFAGSPATTGEQSVGDVLRNMIHSSSNFTNLISLVAYLTGAILIFTGIYKFKDHVDNPSHTPISAGAKRWFAAGLMFSLPLATMAIRGSLFGDTTSNPTVTGFTDAQLTSDGLDAMIVRFIGNIMTPALGLLTAFTYIAGFGLLLVGISRLTKRMDEGPRGPGGAGTIMTFIASGALFSFANSAGVFVSSIFGDNQLMTNVQISPSTINEAADRAKIEKVVEGLMLFIMLVGYIAFVRGWFVLKSFADGNSGATVSQGLTFLLGGTLAINLGELINALSTTVGVSGFLSFS